MFLSLCVLALSSVSHLVFCLFTLYTFNDFLHPVVCLFNLLSVLVCSPVN